MITVFLNYFCRDMVSFWPSPRKTVLTETFLFPLKTSSPFRFGAQGASRSPEMAWMQIIFAVSC